VTGGKLEEAVLRQEIGRIEKLGAWFYPSTEVDPSNFRRLEKEFDAILISSGSLDEEHDPFGIERSDKGVKADRQTYQTGTEKVFAAGSAVRNSRMAIKPLGEGKEAAASIDQYLRGEKVTGTSKVFNSRFGPLLAEELGEYMKEGNAGERIEPAVIKDGYTKEDVRAEASRCLHCDCRALDDCKLRTLSDEYQAKQKRFWSQDRKKVEKYNQHEFVIYEPNKCIKCGICVRIAEEHKEKFGLSFIGRGFDVVIGVPFGEALSAGLEEVARQVVEECPTGALASRELDK
jgi:NAD-dependent dihydropyrimidine dehydrogenase PreA subunit